MNRRYYIYALILAAQSCSCVRKLRSYVLHVAVGNCSRFQHGCVKRCPSSYQGSLPTSHLLFRPDVCRLCFVYINKRAKKNISVKYLLLESIDFTSQFTQRPPTLYVRLPPSSARYLESKIKSLKLHKRPPPKHTSFHPLHDEKPRLVCRVCG